MMLACEYLRLYDPYGKFTLPKFPSILTEDLFTISSVPSVFSFSVEAKRNNLV